MTEFSVETHRYADGGKPKVIAYLPGEDDGLGWYSIDRNGCIYWHRDDGICNSSECSNLIPIPAPPAYWGKPEDVDPLIDRVRYAKPDGSFLDLGYAVQVADIRGIHCLVIVRNASSPTCLVLQWDELSDYEYRRIGESTWRPCTTSEGA